MEFITRRPLTFPFFSARSDAKPVANPEPESQALQLSQLIKQQPSVNDLIYYCDNDDNGKLNCRWIKACSL